CPCDDRCKPGLAYRAVLLARFHRPEFGTRNSSRFYRAENQPASICTRPAVTRFFDRTDRKSDFPLQEPFRLTARVTMHNRQKSPGIHTTRAGAARSRENSAAASKVSRDKASTILSIKRHENAGTISHCSHIIPNPFNPGSLRFRLPS